MVNFQLSWLLLQFGGRTPPVRVGLLQPFSGPAPAAAVEAPISEDRWGYEPSQEGAETSLKDEMILKTVYGS